MRDSLKIILRNNHHEKWKINNLQNKHLFREDVLHQNLRACLKMCSKQSGRVQQQQQAQ